MNTANEIVAEIQKHLTTPGNVVQLCTHLRAVVYSNPEQFKATKSGAYVRNGRRWECFATASRVLVAVRFGRVA